MAVALEVLQTVQTLASLLSPSGTGGCFRNSTNCRQRATLFASRDGAGNFTQLGTLHEQNFQRTHSGIRALSANVTGVWLFYSTPNYGDKLYIPFIEAIFSKPITEFVYGHGRVVNFSGSKLRSARYAGLSYDYTQPTITFYAKPYFQGEETMFVEDTIAIGFLAAKSLIITGKSPWTVYARSAFTPNETDICIYPPAQADNPPAFIKRLSDVMRTSFIWAVRVGCHVDRIYKASLKTHGSISSQTIWTDTVEMKAQLEGTSSNYPVPSNRSSVHHVNFVILSEIIKRISPIGNVLLG